MQFYESTAYDTWCRKVYGRALKQSGMVTYKELETMYDHITLIPDSHILDIGCGLGRITADIAHHYSSSAVGIDIDEEMIALAEHEFSGRADLTFKVMDAGSIGTEQGRYDMICLLDSIYFITDTSMLDDFLDGCLSILDTGGRIVVFSSDVPANELHIESMVYNKEIGRWSKERSVILESVCLSEDFRHFWINAFSACLDLNKTMKEEIPEAFEKLLLKCSVFSDISSRHPESMERWLNIISKE